MCLAVTSQLDCTVSAPLSSVSSACRLCGQLQSARLQLVSSAVNVKCQLGRDLSAWLPSVSSSAHCKLICSLPASHVYVQLQWNPLSSNLSAQLQLVTAAAILKLSSTADCQLGCTRATPPQVSASNLSARLQSFSTVAHCCLRCNLPALQFVSVHSSPPFRHHIR